MKAPTTWFIPENPHEKGKDSIYCEKKEIIWGVNFIHFHIEEWAGSLIEFQSKYGDSIIKKTTFWK